MSRRSAHGGGVAGSAPDAATGSAFEAATGGVPKAATGGARKAATGRSPKAVTGGTPRAATGGTPKAATGGTPDAATSDARRRRRPSDVSERLYVAESDVHGLGMFAATRLRANVTLGRLAGMPTHDDGTYVLWLNDELGLEVTNDFRFINHSKTPNCELTDVDVVTLRAVRADEELTHDYGWPA